LVSSSPIESRPTRVGASEDGTEINLAHHGELLQIVSVAIDVGAHVEQHGACSHSGRKNRSQRGTIHSGQRAQDHLGRGHGCAGVSGGDESGRFAFANQANAHVHGRLLLGADRLRGLVFHGDDFVSVNDFDGKLRDPAVATQFRPDGLLTICSARSELTGGLNRPLDSGRGSDRTRCIQRTMLGMEALAEQLAGFFHFHYFAAFVVTALGAGAVRHFLLVAVRALRERVLRQRIMRAAGGTAFLGVSPFWIRHGKFLFFECPIQAQLEWDFRSGW
jgi:hypothetical protein